MNQQTTGTKFKDLSFFNKILFVGKLVVFMASFGFAFPQLLNGD